MPVIAVVAAVAIDAGAIGALAAGTLTTLAAVTAIGATLGAIGAVTGNKTLGLVGAGLGLVGGIATLAFGSGALGNAGDLFGSSASTAGAGDAAAAVGDGGVAAGGAEAAYQPGAVTAAEMPGTGIVNATGGVDTLDPAGMINSTLAPAEGDAAAIASGGDTGSALGQSLTGEASTTVNGPTQVSAFAPETGTMPPPGGVTPDFMSQFNKTFNTLPDGVEITDAASKSGGIFGWAQKNPLLSYGILQAGGSFISGLTNPMTPAQIEALNAQAAENRAAAALLERQTANLGQPLPSATAASPPVTGKPAPTGGLINSSRPYNTPLITGAPNTGAPPVPAGASV